MQTQLGAAETAAGTCLPCKLQVEEPECDSRLDTVEYHVTAPPHSSPHAREMETQWTPGTYWLASLGELVPG